VRRWEQTDDVLQNAVLRLCRALQDVQPQTPRDFLGLATLQIRRELIDLARHYYGAAGLGAHHASAANAAGTDESQVALATPADSTCSPVRLTAWGDFHEKVAELPPEEREVFELLWYQEVSYADAASVLGISDSTVKRRWQSARRRLYDLLQGELPF
jgi:RNA polymerase sigma-70 factor (ECF subfamily)